MTPAQDRFLTLLEDERQRCIAEAVPVLLSNMNDEQIEAACDDYERRMSTDLDAVADGARNVG